MAEDLDIDEIPKRYRSFAKEIDKVGDLFHITFDAVGCRKEIINDEEEVFSMLFDLPDILDMRILNGPILTRDYNPDNTGVTGLAIISFSHITMHTFADSGVVLADVFSCKEFDVEKVREFLMDRISPDEVVSEEVLYPWERASISEKQIKRSEEEID